MPLTMFAGPERREINWTGVYREVVAAERLIFTICTSPIASRKMGSPLRSKLHDAEFDTVLATLCETPAITSPSDRAPHSPRRRGVNSSQVADPWISPLTIRHPPTASVGNMYLHWSHRVSGAGAGR